MQTHAQGVPLKKTCFENHHSNAPFSRKRFGNNLLKLLAINLGLLLSQETLSSVIATDLQVKPLQKTEPIRPEHGIFAASQCAASPFSWKREPQNDRPPSRPVNYRDEWSPIARRAVCLLPVSPQSPRAGLQPGTGHAFVVPKPRKLPEFSRTQRLRATLPTPPGLANLPRSGGLQHSPQRAEKRRESPRQSTNVTYWFREGSKAREVGGQVPSALASRWRRTTTVRSRAGRPAG